MPSPFFSPSFAFSSHFDPDGAALGGLSWSPSLAVVAVSFSGLFTVVVLMLACLCCKKGGIGFKEFENADGDGYTADRSAQGSPATAAQGGPDVYVLPLTEVCLPMAKQPGRSVQLLKSTELGRHSLLYLQEIGHGWFGKVFLGEVHAGASSTRVVVKELQVSASVQEQAQFLEEAQPHRALQHSNLLQCLAQCTEVTPYLLVMEFCPLGDLKGYLRSCRVSESMAPDPLTLQRMACEVACGLVHLHGNNYVHSDLALRNCLLTGDLTVKIGDYGLSHCKYREDYLVTADQLWVPLRWIAPELVDEVHNNLLVVDQTKASNVWSLGVTIWELFELGAQPYPHHSDRQVLAYAVREQQLKLPKPQLQLTLADRWYEVMQFCWLQPEQRPTAEEVHLLLSYLCAKGATEAEEEFERRWRSLRPCGGGAGLGAAGPALGGAAELASASSFPLLEQFAGDGFHADGDDVLTVTETSRGLNFEYKWEAGRGADAFSQPLCAPDGAPGVVPVLSAHSPSLGSDYFIRLEEAEPAAGHDPDCAGCAPGQGSDSEGSADASLAAEPLLGPAPLAAGSWGCRDRSSARGSRSRDAPGRPRSPSPSPAEDAGRAVGAFCPRFLTDPLGAAPSGGSGPPLSPGEEQLGEAEARRAAQHRHWRSNVSANNNSGSRDPDAWDPGRAGGCADDCPSPKPAPGASPEPGRLPARGDPGEPLLGPQPLSPSQEPGRCLGLPQPCSPQGVTPAACLATPTWTEAAAPAGADHHQVEPQLAEDAEGSAGPQLPVPSVPSPSQEGAPLPSEEASAPDTLPASPTPAARSRAAASELAGTWDSSSSSPALEVPGGEGEDPTAAAAGIFTRLSSAGQGVWTPESLDSLDVLSSAKAGGCEAGTPGGQPHALDSGCDTENHECPVLTLREAWAPGQPEALNELASEGESPGSETQLAAARGGLSQKNPYRDSAYFSDLDAESDPPAAPEKGRVQPPGPEPGLGGLQGPGQHAGQGAPGPRGPEEAQGTGSGEGWPPLLPLDGSSSEPGACPAGPRLECPQAPGPVQTPPAASSKLFLLTPVPPDAEGGGPGPQGAPRERTGGPLCLALPGRPEEEGDDSEDSESDEELRCYSVREPAEDSEEEAPVPVVVAESQSARSLRGLLKAPSLLALERKKKAVSFFDDVTVYLFDQESPARETGEPLPSAAEPRPPLLPGSPSAPGRPRRAERPPEASVPAEGVRFEWDEDFPLTPAKAALAAAPDPAAPGPATPPAPPSRFTVSPAPASRFSITHVSDADAQPAGGPAVSSGDQRADA